MDPNTPLTWAIIAFLGTGALGVFVGSWKVFNIRKDDHEIIAKAISDLGEKLDAKIDDRYQSAIRAVDRLETATKEDYAVLHGRINKAAEDIGKVTSMVEYQRGVTDTMKDFILCKWGNENVTGNTRQDDS